MGVCVWGGDASEQRVGETQGSMSVGKIPLKSAGGTRKLAGRGRGIRCVFTGAQVGVRVGVLTGLGDTANARSRCPEKPPAKTYRSLAAASSLLFL